MQYSFKVACSRIAGVQPNASGVPWCMALTGTPVPMQVLYSMHQALAVLGAGSHHPE